MMRNSHVILVYAVFVYVILETFLLMLMSAIKANSRTQTDEPPRYSPKSQSAGRQTETKAS